MSVNDLYILIGFCCIIMIASVATYFKNPVINFSIDFRDLIVFSGIGLIGVGAHMIYEPSAFIVCGSMLFWLGRPR